MAPISATRVQILAFRRHVQSLDQRLPWTAASLRTAAWAGIQDSMPRAALLSIHARVAGTTPSALDHSSLVQVWGPRYSAYVVAKRDVAPFTLGRYPDDARGRRRAEDMAAMLAGHLRGREMKDRDIHRATGAGNGIRYATTTGRVLITWDGARAPIVRMVPEPTVEPMAARLDLARRYLHLFGPTDAAAFARWAGISDKAGRDAFAGLAGELIAVRTPIGDRWLLADDEAALRRAVDPSTGARLLPSGDTYFLLWSADRELLIPESKRRALLWTSRVWPGAVLLDGEIVGTWRRATAVVDVEPWKRLSAAERASVEAEAGSLPLPGLKGDIRVRWADVT